MLDLAHDHDREHLLLALRYVTNWRRAVDCGAHVGTWAGVLAQRFERVVAFEPCRENFEALEKAMPANVVCMNAAVGSEHCGVAMAPGDENTGQWHIAGAGNTPAVPLDSLGIDDAGFIKFDVEGYELFALRGAEKTILASRPVVLIEENGLCARYGVAPGAAGEFLEGLGATMVARANKDYVYAFRNGGASC